MEQQSPRHQEASLGKASKTPPRWRKLIVPLAVLVMAVSVGGTVAWRHNAVPNFGCVEPGVLYRSGQPDARGLRVLVKNYGIKTVVNLRSPAKVRSDPRGREEMDFARRTNTALISLHYREAQAMAIAQEFLRIVGESKNRPVLVHCSRGEERAGLMAAVYRMAVNRWTPARALAEMESYGFEPEKQPEMRRFVEDFSAARVRMDVQTHRMRIEPASISRRLAGPGDIFGCAARKQGMRIAVTSTDTAE